ncbi:MAG: SDR family oxidoreductase [Chromatiales bacterium]|nr:SDR family oxidoreductase [Chromatiales bacterium]
MSERLENKVIVITGAAGGIGQATVERVVSEGAKVLAVDMDMSALKEALGQIDGDVECVVADVTQEAQVQGYLQAAVDKFGGIDSVFNNAGIEGVTSKIVDYPTDMYERVMDVNVKGVFLGIKHAVPHLLARGGGSIVNTASTAGLRGAPLLPAYNASKHAVIGLTRSTAEAYGRDGIRTNAVCPAPINTRMMRSIELGMGGNEPDAIRSRFESTIPLGRYGEAHEVASLVAFLLSSESSFINGSMYSIDGGSTPY